MKGICFKEPLFRAVINGTKTQMRQNIKYKVGEVLFLKEPYKVILGSKIVEISTKFSSKNYIYYKNKFDFDVNKWAKKKLLEQNKTNFCNKLFMPAFAAKKFIKIKNVRCEKLQNISDKDCEKEGITVRTDFDTQKLAYFVGSPSGANNRCYCTPQEAYATLIDKINGKGMWDDNPYVWVYDFVLCDKNGDSLK